MGNERSSAGSSAGFVAGAIAAAAASKGAAVGLEKMSSKAILYVKMLGWDIDPKGKGKAVDGASSKANEDIEALRALTKERDKSSSKLAKMAGGVIKQSDIVADATKAKMTSAQINAAMLAKGFIPVQVQYNPSSITMNSVGGKIKNFQTMGNENLNSMTSTDKQTSTYLSVDLIYEDINVADAFGTSSMNMNVSDAKDTVLSTIKNVANGGYSIKKPVEGLLSLMMEKETRQVIFVWNNMFFHGVMTSVSVDFTMFNKRGMPIKAKVSIQIQQSNTNQSFSSDKQYWDSAFDVAFGLNK